MEAVTQATQKIDLAPWGYAPGDYFFTCFDCTKAHPLDDLHIGHKHSTRCAKHALEARQSDIRAAEGMWVPNPDQTLQDEVYGLIKPYSDKMMRILFIGSILLAGGLVGTVIFAYP